MYGKTVDLCGRSKPLPYRVLEIGNPAAMCEITPFVCRDRQMFAKQTLNFACEVSPTAVQENNAHRTAQSPARRTFKVGRPAAMCEKTVNSFRTVEDACPYNLIGYLAAMYKTKPYGSLLLCKATASGVEFATQTSRRWREATEEL